MLFTSTVRSRIPGNVAIRNVGCAIVQNVFVDFVSNCKGVEFLAKTGDQFEFGAAEYLPSGIVR